MFFLREIRFTVKHEMIVVFASEVIWRFGRQIIVVNRYLTSAQMIVLMLRFSILLLTV